VRAWWRAGTPADAELVAAVAEAAALVAEWRDRAVDAAGPRPPADPAVLAAAREALGRLDPELVAVGALAAHADLASRPLDDLRTVLDGLLADQVTLTRLPEVHRLGDDLSRRGLDDVVADGGARGLDPGAAVAALGHVWAASVLEAVALTDPVVGAFDGPAHHRVAAEFGEADRAHIASTPARVRRLVAEWAVRSRDEHPGESDVSEKQARLKRRHLPVRQLFEAAPHVLGAMKPCWAMSPLVVAQLLPPERCFDVVIFDEASQVTPAGAVGALLRADRAVVAGDTHQLPPTAFFEAAERDDPDGTDATDGGAATALTSGMESVLEVMGALLPPPHGTRRLEWHYRSRDERLIAFSNAQPTLYDWSLTTFPGVAGGDCLRHVLVPWQPGRTEQEESVADEVDRVVELVLEQARTRPHESLGVIAMGITHAERVTEAIRRARAGHPELDGWFDGGPDGHEPFFVKNLERVQGDERDAILLTVGYGKTADGRLLHRFGPLNLEGGERRLNVAITRARSRMTVVSSFASTDLDPERVRAEGARMLGRFLAYAESGGAQLGEVAATHTRPAPDAFERDLHAALAAAGIPVDAPFGRSGSWIDVAARHPDRPGRMVLAVEGDGATYRAGATVRDRDRLRGEHLARLGWVGHRIWSTDWARDRDPEVRRARAAWDAAVAAADAHDATAAAPPAPAVPPPPVPLLDATPAAPTRGPRPQLAQGVPIDEHPPAALVALVRWIESDERLRTEEELVDEAIAELGYRRRGPRIVEAVTRAVHTARTARGANPTAT
jgi:hypothetical protein